MGQNEDLSDKYVTYKLTMLLALTSASRVLGLQHSDIRVMTKGTNNCRSTLKERKSTFLLSFVKPHNPVVSSAISGWIKNVLREAGICTKIFKGHSTRSASTSKAGLAGLSMTDILERGSSD